MATLPPEPSVKPASPMSSWQAPQANSNNIGESVATHRNRWLKKVTVDLLRIRSDMDVAFQDAALNGPLWDEVSRKMGELGYKRSGTKCKEKFKKARKEGPNSRADHKNYCFFGQLEALHGSAIAPAPAAPAPTLHPVSATAIAPPPGSIWSDDTGPITEPGKVPQPTGLSFSSNNWSSSSSESDDKSKEASEGEGRKQKRDISGGAGGSRMMRAFLEGLMNQVVERQETMLQRFFEAIDKREAERLAREEAWRLQEATRLAHEHTLLSHERATAATRDAAILSFLQKLTGQSGELPPPPPAPEQPTPSAPQPPQSHPSPLQNCSTVMPQPLAPAALELVPVPVPVPDPKPVRMVAFSRWTKDEIEMLIRIRSRLDHRYQEAGAKGPLWDEISVEMLRQGYNRSAKKCKEKWENINKYFKRMKENSRRRSPDAKTCPYYHQLDTLYYQKLLSNRMVSSQNPLEVAQGVNKDNRPVWNAEGSGGAVTKVEDIVMELSMVKDAGNDYENLNGLETDHMEKANDDDAEGRKMQDEVLYQRQNKRRSGGGETCSFFAML